MKTTDQNVLNQKAEALKAIAHPVRMSIINHLVEKKQMNVTEIHDILNLEQATASHHLGILKNKGVLSAERDGKNTIYSIKNESVIKLAGSIDGLTF